MARMAQNQEEVAALAFTIGDRLRKAREVAGLKQDELASILGVARRSMNRWERGASVPRRPVLVSWALRCRVPYEWLVTGDVLANGPDGGGTMASHEGMPWRIRTPLVAAAA